MRKIFGKYNQVFSYFFWGTGTTIVNYGVYFLCTELIELHHLISNTIAWVLSVAYAFVVNKVLVFSSKSWKPEIALKEFYKFVSARFLSGVLETLLLLIFVDCLEINDAIIKILASILIVVINYFLSKRLIFKK